MSVADEPVPPDHRDNPDFAPPVVPEQELEVTGYVRESKGLENTQWIRLDHLRFFLATHDLCVVTKAEQQVLKTIQQIVHETEGAIPGVDAARQRRREALGYRRISQRVYQVKKSTG